MSLSQRLNEDMKAAMKAKDKQRLATIRMLLAAIKNREIELRRPLEDQDVLDVLGRELKQRRESLQEFEKAGRDDLVRMVSAEIEIIAGYLPQPLTEEELEALVRQTAQEIGATTKADMGRLMGALMPKVKGRADGKLVNQLAQRILSGN